MEEFQIIYVYTSPLNEVRHSSPPFRWGLHMLTSFQRAQEEKWGGSATLGKPKRGYRVGQTIMSSQVLTIACPFDMMWWEWPFTSVLFLPKSTTQVWSWKRIRHIQRGTFSWNTWPELLKTANVIKNKGSLKNCHRHRSRKRHDDKEWCSLLDGRELGKNWRNPNEVLTWVNNVLTLVYWLWQC